jgi:8-oxo-dGTP diphosphatase
MIRQAETNALQPQPMSQDRQDGLRPALKKGRSRRRTANDVVSHIRVAVAIIEQQGRYLITQRRSTDVLAGLWEFPSGRVETGETDEAALRRELRERAGIAADVGDVIAHRTHYSDGCVVDLVLYRATIPLTKQPRPLRVAELRWVAPQELENYAFPPADQATTDLLLEINRDSQLAGEAPAQAEHAQGQERAVN